MNAKTKNTTNKAANTVRMTRKINEVSVNHVSPETKGKTRHQLRIESNKKAKQEVRSLSTAMRIYIECFAMHMKSCGLSAKHPDLTPSRLTKFMSESEKSRHERQNAILGYAMFSAWEVSGWIQRYADSKNQAPVKTGKTIGETAKVAKVTKAPAKVTEAPVLA